MYIYRHFPSECFIDLVIFLVQMTDTQLPTLQTCVISPSDDHRQTFCEVVSGYPSDLIKIRSSSSSFGTVISPYISSWNVVVPSVGMLKRITCGFLLQGSLQSLLYLNADNVCHIQQSLFRHPRQTLCFSKIPDVLCHKTVVSIPLFDQLFCIFK